jgi:hypothetical protein
MDHLDSPPCRLYILPRSEGSYRRPAPRAPFDRSDRVLHPPSIGTVAAAPADGNASDWTGVHRRRQGAAASPETGPHSGADEPFLGRSKTLILGIRTPPPKNDLGPKRYHRRK